MVKQLEHYIIHEMAQPLSIERLKTYVRRDGLKWKQYEDIKKGDTIDDLVGLEGGCIILWSSVDAKIGHYTLLARWKNKIIYYDPLGLSVHKLATITGNDNRLEKILKGYDVTWNHFQYQKVKASVQTCGRAAVLRWNLITFNAKQWKGLMSHRNLSPDKIVTLLTLNPDLSHWSEILKSEK